MELVEWYHKLPINVFNLGGKRAQGCPLVTEGRGALLIMPRRNTTLYLGIKSLFGWASHNFVCMRIAVLGTQMAWRYKSTF
jgi:hypothetical protein